MKKLILLSFSILLTFGISAQIDIDKSKINPAYLKFLPSNANQISDLYKNGQIIYH